jgi:ABC-2 type transport system permease protein
MLHSTGRSLKNMMMSQNIIKRIFLNLKLYKVGAFIKKDFSIETSYKMGFLLVLLNSVLPVFTYFFIGKLMQGQKLPNVETYANDYFSFALIGIAFATYFNLAIQIFSGSMRRAQMAGCLEAILSSQTDSKTVVFLSSLYSFISTGIMLLCMFFISWLYLGFDFSKMNVAASMVSLFFSLTTFISLGILSAAGTIIFKQGEPFAFIFGGISSLLGGTLFPVAVLPSWLQIVSYVVPIKYSLDALRLSILQGYSIHMISSQLITLGVISTLLFPLSLLFFQWAVEKGKRDGTLMQY